MKEENFICPVCKDESEFIDDLPVGEDWNFYDYSDGFDVYTIFAHDSCGKSVGGVLA